MGPSFNNAREAWGQTIYNVVAFLLLVTKGAYCFYTTYLTLLYVGMIDMESIEN